MDQNNCETLDPMWQDVREPAYRAASDAMYWSDTAKIACTEDEARTYAMRAGRAAATAAVRAAQEAVKAVMDEMVQAWEAEEQRRA
jgi:hypothetical protein